MQKNVFMIGGPNGAGKTTVPLNMLPHRLDIEEFVNADIIANGLSPLNPKSMQIQAAKLMIGRIAALTESGKSFAFETTCAGKNHVHTLKKRREAGYVLNLIFLWLPDVETAIERVAMRVRQGGHSIEESVIRRRYKAGLRNLITTYIPVCDNVMVFDGLTEKENQKRIFEKEEGSERIINQSAWNQIQRSVK